LEWLRTWSFGIHPPTATSTLVSALGNYLAVVGGGGAGGGEGCCKIMAVHNNNNIMVMILFGG
jgi:hypothetical protein